jgi:TRAP transporter TAXI family solute receptor
MFRTHSDDTVSFSWRDALRAALLFVASIAAILWAVVHFLQPAPPRRFVLASGPSSGIYHHFAQRYKEILARDGVTVEERMTDGAADNLRLLLDPKSGVDAAFMQGGIATIAEAQDLRMLASLYYEPLWVFYRGADMLTQINQLKGKRIAVGVTGSGTRAFVEPLLAANGVTPSNSAWDSIGGTDALSALNTDQVNVALYVGGAQTPTILQALRDPAVKLMSVNRVDGYARRFPYITKLTLPAGTIDFALDIPQQNVDLIATKAMLAARLNFHPALINLMLDAATEIHSEQGYFEAAGEFPGIAPVDLPVSTDADQHKRFGPSFLHRYLPFWIATVIERLIVLLLPLVVVLVPLINFLPRVHRWRVRSRIYRWYGELALLERDVATRQGALPVEKWLHDLDRIEGAAASIRTPASFASEAYTLREHIGLVRRAVLAKAASVTKSPQAAVAPSL